MQLTELVQDTFVTVLSDEIGRRRQLEPFQVIEMPGPIAMQNERPAQETPVSVSAAGSTGERCCRQVLPFHCSVSVWTWPLASR